MKMLPPPAAATWLLEQLYCGQRNDSLTGDLVERYRQGRSRGWYWRQVLAAILVSFGREIRGHSVLALRALVTGWAVWNIYTHFLVRPSNQLLALLRMGCFFGISVSPGAVGLGQWVIWLSVRTASGWLVARLHRPHQKAMVLLFAASVFLWKARALPETYRLMRALYTHTLLEPRYVNDYVSTLLVYLVGIFLPPICVLLGGLWLASADAEPPVRESRIGAERLI